MSTNVQLERDLFHAPIPNNWVHMLVPRHRDVTGYVREIEESTEPLNRADAALLEVCAGLIEATPNAGAGHALAMWRDCVARRRNLDGVRWARELVGRLGIPFAGWLAERHADVLDRFRAVPTSIRDLVRINGYLSSAQIEPCLASIAAVLRAGVVPLPIERLEVARLSEPVSRPTFPTVIVYLSASTVAAASDRDLETTLGVFLGILEALEPSSAVFAEYALPVAHNTTLTQGFTLYKRHLELVGILGELYDPAHDHALAHGSRLVPLFASG
jgi:hypothetical protein